MTDGIGIALRLGSPSTTQSSYCMKRGFGVLGCGEARMATWHEGGLGEAALGDYSRLERPGCRHALRTSLYREYHVPLSDPAIDYM